MFRVLHFDSVELYLHQIQTQTDSSLLIRTHLWSTAVSLRASLATCVAFLQPEMMVCGWIFLAISSSASCEGDSDVNEQQ